jgi:quinol-cytochrome oxidoreductase complex cytochrome b subunit
MKPEWPLYGLCAGMTIVVFAVSRVLDWSDQTANLVAFAALAVILWTYLPRIDRRSDRRGPKTRSARS